MVGLLFLVVGGAWGQDVTGVVEPGNDVVDDELTGTDVVLAFAVRCRRTISLLTGHARHTCTRLPIQIADHLLNKDHGSAICYLYLVCLHSTRNNPCQNFDSYLLFVYNIRHQLKNKKR